MVEVNLITRGEWGARPPRRGRLPTIPTPSEELWLHHTAGNNSGEAGMRAIQDFHVEQRNYADIGYSFVVDPGPDMASPSLFEGRGSGRIGAHTRGRNRRSHGVAVMGNFSVLRPTLALLEYLGEVVFWGHEQGHWGMEFTGGHRDTRKTECPGNFLYPEIHRINAYALAASERGDDEDGPNDVAVGGAIRPGAEGVAVEMIQTALATFATITVDGDYGPATTAAVSAYQQITGLPATGVVDGVTAAFLLRHTPL